MSPKARETIVVLGLLVSCSTAAASKEITAAAPQKNTAAAPLPYTLSQLKDSALRNNIAVRQATLDVDAARQQRRETFTKYFPTVSATGAWFNANRGMAKMDIDPQAFITPEMGATLAQMLPAEALAALGSPMSMTMMKNGTIASVTALQPVFAGGQIVNGNRLARVGEEASRLQLRLKEQEVERQVEQYYWQLVSLQEKMKTVDAVDSLLSSIYKDVEVAVRAGVTMPGDLLQVQLRRNDIESQRVKLQNGIHIVQLLLKHYCGLQSSGELQLEHLVFPDSLATSPEETSALTTLGATPNDSSAISLLPEYQLLEKQVETTALQKKMAVGQQLPTVAVGAGYNYHNLLENDRTFAMLFATVSVPISDWWGGSHTIKRRKLEHQKALDQLSDNAQLLQIRMQKAAGDVVEARQQLAIAQRSIEQAAENLRIGRNQYQAGVSTMSALLEAQLLYQQTLDHRTDAWADLQNKLLDYRQATGQ